MTDNVDLPTLLGRIPLFREMDESERAHLAAGTRFLKAQRGDILFRRGDPSEGFYYLIQGRVKIFISSAQGTEKVVEIMRDGMTFGEAVMFINAPYPATAQVLDASHLLHIQRAVVIDSVQQDSRFALRMLAGLSRRLHGIVRDIEAYSLRSSTERVIGYLLREAESACGEDGVCTLQLPVAKAVIASRLNLTPETLSRALHELSDAGLIEVHGREVVLTDVERLRGYG